MKKYNFKSLPSVIDYAGSFGDNCYLYLDEVSLESLNNNKLRISINRQGRLTNIDRCYIYIASIEGNIRILLGANNINVKFGQNVRGAYDLRMWKNSKVFIGDDTTSNGIRIICQESEFITGKDCMFSDNILIQSSDQHGLVDLKTGKIFNLNYKKIELGNHVWLGRKCILMPNIFIGSGSIVGTGAIVTSDIPDKSIAVGIPAKVVKSDVTWCRNLNHLDEFAKEYINNYRQ